MQLRVFLASSVTALLACTPSVTKDEATPVSASTIALFAPDSADPCRSVLPFPSDLAKDPVSGRLNLPYCREDTAEQTAMKTGLRTLDGYALGVTLTAKFSAPVDAASAASAVKLFKASGEPVAFGATFRGDTLYIQPSAPLSEATKYLVAVTTDLKDAEGQPVSPDQVFVFASSREPLVDEKGYSRFAALADADAYALEALRKGLAPLFGGLEALGVERSKIAVAWAFTTQTAHATFAPLAALTRGNASAHWESRIAAKDHALIAAAGIPADALCDVHTGRIELTDLLTASGTFGVDSSGAPLSGTAVADYLLITPNLDSDPEQACSTPWPADRLVVFAHGLGRCKNDALALANGFAKAGWAVLSVDGPKAGARTLGNLGDQDLDGCADQPATPEFIALPGAGANPFAVRDHLRQWALELVQIANFARAHPAQLAGMEGGTQPAKVALVGHSWGGIAAALGRGEHGDLAALVVNGASAELGAVFAPTIEATLAAQLEQAGVQIGTEEGKALLAQKVAESVAAFRWAMEPADPLYGGASDAPALVQVVSAGPAMADAALHATATQQQLAAAFGESAASSTVELSYESSGNPAAICDGATGVVGALLMPCVEDASSSLYPLALAKTAGLQRQAITFVATAAGGTPLVCDPDITQACP